MQISGWFDKSSLDGTPILNAYGYSNLLSTLAQATPATGLRYQGQMPGFSEIARHLFRSGAEVALQSGVDGDRQFVVVIAVYYRSAR